MVIPVTQLQHQAESAVALRNDELRQAEEFERQRAAYNALRRSYGAIAGDPAAALDLQSYGHNEQMNPLLVENQQLMNTYQGDRNNYLRQSYPLELEGLALGNEGTRLTNEGQGIDNRGADAELREKALVDGARYVKRRVSEGVDIAAAFDEVAPQLPVPPGQLAELRTALTSDPAQLDAFLENYGAEQQGGNEDERFGLTPQPVTRRLPDGTVQKGMMQMSNMGGAQFVPLEEGVEWGPNLQRSDLGNRVQYYDRDSGEVLGTEFKGGTPPEGSEPIVDEEGNLTGWHRLPGSDAAIELGKKENSRKGLSGNLAKMTGWYTELDEMGAITNTDKSSLSNAMAYLRNTGPGQLVEKIAGSDAQSWRNQIENARPLLIMQMRQASEMGARGLDSDKELQFYSQAATNLTGDMLSNLVALDVLDQAYGAGTAVKSMVSPEIYREISERTALELKQSARRAAAEKEGQGGEFSDMSDEELNDILRGK